MARTQFLVEAARSLAKMFGGEGIFFTTPDGTTLLYQEPLEPTTAELRWPLAELTLPALQEAGTAQTGVAGTHHLLAALVRPTPTARPVLVGLWRSSASAWDHDALRAWPLAAQTLAQQAGWAEDVHASTVPAAAVLKQRLGEAALISSRLAHDFGNHLQGALGFGELGLLSVDPDSPVHEYLREVVASAQRGRHWVNKLRLFCRTDGGQAVWPTALLPLLRKQQALPTFAEVRWQLDLPEPLPLLAIEAEALEQVLAEIFDNAHTAMNGKGTLRVTGTVRSLDAAACQELLGEARPGPHLELVVQDSGPGLAPEMHARLFTEPFSSSKPRHRGLGLLIVHGLLKRFGGGLSIRPTTSAGPGDVRLVLPIEPLPERGGQLEGMRLLLVHGDPTHRESLRHVLEYAGAAVVLAADAAEALVASQPARGRFDLVVIELNAAAAPNGETSRAGLELGYRLLQRDTQTKLLFVQMQPGFAPPLHDDLIRRHERLSRPFQPGDLIQAVLRRVPRPQAVAGSGSLR